MIWEAPTEWYKNKELVLLLLILLLSKIKNMANTNKLKTFLGNMGDVLSPSTKNERIGYEKNTEKTQREIDRLVERNKLKKKREAERKERERKAKNYLDANPKKDGDSAMSAIELQKKIDEFNSSK